LAMRPVSSVELLSTTTTWSTYSGMDWSTAAMPCSSLKHGITTDTDKPLYMRSCSWPAAGHPLPRRRVPRQGHGDYIIALRAAQKFTARIGLCYSRGTDTRSYRNAENAD